MKNLYHGAIFVGLLVLSNVVAAGVIAVLGPIARELEDESAQIMAMAIIGTLAVCCALIFLRGAVFYAMELAAGPRGFYGDNRAPNKGLQSAAGQRGG